MGHGAQSTGEKILPALSPELCALSYWIIVIF